MKAKNWNEFQHYKDRRPSWIKLHKDLLDDYTFQRLPIASRALAPMLWLLASESQDGTVTDDAEEIAFRLRWSVDEVREALKPLIDKGFFIDASSALAEPEQAASLEREKRREEKIHTFDDSNACGFPKESISLALRAYEVVAKESGLPVPQGSPRQRNLIHNRLKTHGPAAWQDACSKIRASPFLQGKTGRNSWRGATLDWLCKAANFEKVLEGNYDSVNNSSDSIYAGLFDPEEDGSSGGGEPLQRLRLVAP